LNPSAGRGIAISNERRGGGDASSPNQMMMMMPGPQAQSAEKYSAAQLLAAARMSSNFLGTDDPSSSMLRYQSSHPDLSPAAITQLASPKPKRDESQQN